MKKPFNLEYRAARWRARRAINQQSGQNIGAFPGYVDLVKLLDVWIYERAKKIINEIK